MSEQPGYVGRLREEIARVINESITVVREDFEEDIPPAERETATMGWAAPSIRTVSVNLIEGVAEAASAILALPTLAALLGGNGWRGIESKFKIGDHATKPKGYRFDSEIRAVFTMKAGAVRLVAENSDGILHIFNEGQLARPLPAPPPLEQEETKG
jgi:hypothetical protein